MFSEGTEAINHIKEILHPNEHCITLAKEVFDFYGTDFCITTGPADRHAIDPNANLSTIAFRYTPNEPDKDCMYINLKTNTGRDLEALTHELLHAQLRMKGFPSANIRKGQMICDLRNHIDHMLMFQDFQRMGLDIDKFYTTDATLTNEEFEKLIIKTKYNEVDWCYRWTCNWVDVQIFGPHRYTQWSDEQWPRVLDKFPNLRQTTPQIEEWFESGVYASPDRFIKVYEELVKIVGCTCIPDGCWFYLKPGDGKPTINSH